MTSLAAVCLTHRRVPVHVLEQFPRAAAAGEVMQSVRRLPQVSGCVVLSTCNRFEVYVSGDTSLRLRDVLEVVAGCVGDAVSELASLADCLTGMDAVRHLFDVAAGLDSRLVGENEILGQVRASAQASARAGCLDMELAMLTQRAVRAGRRARRTSGPSGIRSSVADHAVHVLDKLVGGIAGRRVLVLGAGHLGSRATRTLASAGATTVVCARDLAKARAATPEASTMPIEMMPTVVGAVDAVICATSAPTPLLNAAMLRDAVAERESGPLLIVDLGVPRNVAGDVAELPNVVYLDLDGLAGCDNALPAVEHRAAAARDVIDAETAAYAAARAERDVSALLQRVTARSEQIREVELLRVSDRLSADEVAVADELARRLLAKVLHPVLTGIRAAAAAGDVDGALSAARIFCGDGLESSAAGRQQAS